MTKNMLLLKRAGQACLLLSLIGFLWVAWLLIGVPTELFNTQGPGVFGAIVLLFAQISGGVGITLLVIWWVVFWEARLRSARLIYPVADPIADPITRQRKLRPRLISAMVGTSFAALVTLTLASTLEHKFLNFDCPPGTIDYCAWTTSFVIDTFGPIFAVIAVASTIAAAQLRRWRQARTAASSADRL